MVDAVSGLYSVIAIAISQLVLVHVDVTYPQKVVSFPLSIAFILATHVLSRALFEEEVNDIRSDDEDDGEDDKVPKKAGKN